MNQYRSIIQDRQKQLFKLIRDNTSLSVAEAARKLDVSSLTIRRDLQQLEESNLITRYHGGASINPSFQEHEVYLEEKKKLNEQAKDAIGKQTASLIPDNSTVFLNSGTTTLSVLRHLNNKKIRVITNNAYAPTVVWGDSIELIITGGECRSKSKSLIGPFAINTITKVFCDYCILGANGIKSNGTTTSVYAETQINEAMVNACNGKIIVVADNTKIGKAQNFFSIPIEKIDILVTDAAADTDELKSIASNGVEILIAQI